MDRVETSRKSQNPESGEGKRLGRVSCPCLGGVTEMGRDIAPPQKERLQ